MGSLGLGMYLDLLDFPEEHPFVECSGFTFVLAASADLNGGNLYAI